MKMKCYPIKEKYIDTFKNREEVLLDLLKKNSIQLDLIVERIDICDFSMSCIRFYRSGEYELKNNTIIYTNEITKEKRYCALQYNHVNLSSMIGFEDFLLRYFHTCFITDDNFTKGDWFSYHNQSKNE